MGVAEAAWGWCCSEGGTPAGVLDATRVEGPAPFELAGEITNVVVVAALATVVTPAGVAALVPGAAVCCSETVAMAGSAGEGLPAFAGCVSVLCDDAA